VHVVETKPLLRGWSHVVAFTLVAILGTVMICLASASRGERALLILYLTGTLLMFGVSSLYHRFRWQSRKLAILRRLDHSMIFMAIAGANTPIAVIALDGWQRTAVLVTVWGGTVVGLALEWLPLEVPRSMFTAIYVIVGWSAAIAFPQLYNGLGAMGFWLVLGGGILYTIGAVVYALRRPDPWPTVFGFHEVFHLFTVAGAGCHLATIAFVIIPLM
jgi:hemolysin III